MPLQSERRPLSFAVQHVADCSRVGGHLCAGRCTLRVTRVERRKQKIWTGHSLLNRLLCGYLTPAEERHGRAGGK